MKNLLKKVPGVAVVWRSPTVQAVQKRLVRRYGPRFRTLKHRKTLRFMVTGSKGKTTTTVMLARIMAESGFRVGYCTTDGVVIDGEVAHVGDSAGHEGARRILSSSLVDCAVLETARGDLGQRGLYISSCHAAALLNIGWDHVGTGGIESREAMLAHKKQVTDASRGRIVLNAEDALVAPLTAFYGVGRCTLFALDPQAVDAHVGSGGQAVTLTAEKPARIVHRGPVGQHEIISLAEIPCCVDGAVRFNVANALAAIALALAAGVDYDDIRAGLRNFEAWSEALGGERFHVVEGYPFRLVVDRASSPSSIEGFVSALPALQQLGRVHVMMTATGNRPDWFFGEMARIVADAGVDSFVLYDSEILRRKRAAGEVPELLAAGLRAAEVDEARITVARNPGVAVERMVERACPGDLLCFLGAVQGAGLLELVTAELRNKGFGREGGR
ncbi:Mur ligase family protein [Ectothiorhodospira variabilis]|uniref:Mur ligase family protein n=1 Tax=Ectothiorhodospira variabilis TaxID=505694 RepID=UPI001EFAE0CC|nr:Mur ligase family protein [Ectothiorhodospira variabilis]MCG5496049.1 hypothetical protein [Ectothiorhodospira variabilis]MCG5505410.1 hypothetical protein [Ectothiorhodospira variabilis]MCG5508596.1 hypothetical protein [Ectothiorhodospira variabilis]